MPKTAPEIKISPDIKIIGVKPNDFNYLQQALKANKRVTLKQVGLFADGIAVRQNVATNTNYNSGASLRRKIP